MIAEAADPHGVSAGDGLSSGLTLQDGDYGHGHRTPELFASAGGDNAGLDDFSFTTTDVPGEPTSEASAVAGLQARAIESASDAAFQFNHAAFAHTALPHESALEWISIADPVSPQTWIETSFSGTGADEIFDPLFGHLHGDSLWAGLHHAWLV